MMRVLEKLFRFSIYTGFVIMATMLFMQNSPKDTSKNVSIERKETFDDINQPVYSLKRDSDTYVENETVLDEYETVMLMSVIDGDTLLILDNSGLEQKIRLIGVDTPESKHTDSARNNVFGTYASDYTSLILNDYIGNNLYIQYDQAKFDNYGRLLAYVYLSPTLELNSMLNYKLVSEGYAIEMTIEPNSSYSEVFEYARKVAEVNRYGLWQYEDCKDMWLKTINN